MHATGSENEVSIIVLECEKQLHSAREHAREQTTHENSGDFVQCWFFFAGVIIRESRSCFFNIPVSFLLAWGLLQGCKHVLGELPKLTRPAMLL